MLKSLFLVCGAAMLVLCGLQVPAAADTIDSPGANHLVIGPDSYCFNGNGQQFTCTELGVGTGTVWNDTVSGSVTVRNLATGAVAFSGYLGCDDLSGSCSADLNSLLPAGRYQVTASVEDSGEWSCSIYNPDGCSWLTASHESYEWRVVYDGHSTSTYGLYVAPKTTVKCRIAQRGKPMHRVSGRIASTGTNASYAAIPARAHRLVTISRKAVRGGHWQRVKKMRSNATGSFHGKVKAPGARVYKWRIDVPAANGSPAWHGAFGKF